MFKLKERRQLTIQLSVLLAASALSVITGVVFQKELDKMMPDRRSSSTFNEKASGLSGLFELTRRLGYKAARFELPYRQLQGYGQTLITIAPKETLKEFEVDQIIKWVKKGNTWIYLDDFSFYSASDILSKFKMSAKTAGMNKKVDQKVSKQSSLDDLDFKPEMIYVHPIEKFEENKDVGGLKLEPTSRLSGGQPIVEDSLGQIVSFVPLEKGKVIIGGLVSICENRTISKIEYWSNFQFLENWMSTAGGTILFDERAHGYTGGTNVFIRLSRGPAGLVTLQLALILFIGIASGFQRFGRAVAIDSSRRISNLEYINGLANTWSRAKANKLILEILFASFRTRLARALGLAVYEKDDKFAATLKEKLKSIKSEADANVFETYQEALRSDALKDEQVNAIVSSCDKIGADLGLGKVK